MRTSTRLLPVTMFLLLAACGDDGGTTATQGGVSQTGATMTGASMTTPTTGVSDSATGTDTEQGTGTDSATGEPTTSTTSTTGTTGVSETTGTSMPSSESDGTTGAKFDLGGDTESTSTTGAPVDQCKATDDDMGGVGDCTMEAPPDAFEPDIQWSWNGPGLEKESLVTPLVANLTDDNNDGEIDLCDTPDVIVMVTQFPNDGHIYVLDGATGTQHFMIPVALTWSINPAIGDIDNDGLPEIIAATGPGFGGPSFAIAFEHDGTVKWQGNTGVSHSQGGAITLADLDNDGDVEISMDKLIIDHNGQTVVTLPENQYAENFTTVAADLDGDGDLEVVIGPSAYHHDGSVYFQNPNLERGFAQVANLDADPEPEIMVNSGSGLTLLEHTGAIKYQNQKPGGGSSWFRPGTVHDFDGDKVSEVATSASNSYVMFEGDLTVNWLAPVQDASGWAAGTAFDFDGNGVAEAMYADEANLYVFDGQGKPLLNVPRSARTLAEYPVVADVDNDGSAEIVVVSDAGFGGNQTAPTVQVIRDIEDRWIQPRRIWNQHTYHVTNVREDGKIPQFEEPWWQSLNTFRTNSQIEGGEICIPPQ
ncbi:FG-GAP repeat domain-containing protein [Nannocystis punicea]|uniref:VCBS repeat-containing protein n=1 Tax=Nannocystis punicea TaxID=2995304 RepID=A0ABY7H183_9BACT|nr:VCBS repeat-containing protein [Nannocystis poenicansa]WAS92784.1 VCBS repeat-containing protein [Nannocystis poenicansa]